MSVVLVPMAAPGWLVDFGLVVDLTSGALFLLLGLFVAFVRPHRLVNGAFAGFAAAMGIAYVFANLGPDYLDVAGAWVIAVYLVAAVAAIPCLLVIAREFPNELAKGKRAPFRLPAALWAGAAAVQVVSLYLFVERIGTPRFSGLPPAWFIPGMLSFFGFLGAFLFLLLVLAQRIPTLEGPLRAKARRHVALVSLALLPYVALASAGHTMVTFRSPSLVISPGYGVLVLLCLALGLVWFRNASRAAPDERLLFHSVAVACFALPLLGSAFVLVTSDWNKVGILGLSRFAGVAVLGYAILRQGLFDIDIRLKWTLSRGSLAGVFVAGFFIVSESVKMFVDDVYGVMAGLGATAVLAFALSPLERMTRRVADAAMPRVRAQDPAYVLGQKRATYREALVVAWSDGEISVKEMRMLFRLREALALPADEVVRLEREAMLAPPNALRRSTAKRAAAAPSRS